MQLYLPDKQVYDAEQTRLKRVQKIMAEPQSFNRMIREPGLFRFIMLGHVPLERAGLSIECDTRRAECPPERLGVTVLEVHHTLHRYLSPESTPHPMCYVEPGTDLYQRMQKIPDVITVVGAEF